MACLCCGKPCEGTLCDDCKAKMNERSGGVVGGRRSEGGRIRTRENRRRTGTDASSAEEKRTTAASPAQEEKNEANDYDYRNNFDKGSSVSEKVEQTDTSPSQERQGQDAGDRAEEVQRGSTERRTRTARESESEENVSQNESSGEETGGSSNRRTGDRRRTAASGRTGEERRTAETDRTERNTRRERADRTERTTGTERSGRSVYTRNNDRRSGSAASSQGGKKKDKSNPVLFILLGLAVLLIIVAVIVAVVMKGGSKKSDSSDKAQATEAAVMTDAAEDMTEEAEEDAEEAEQTTEAAQSADSSSDLDAKVIALQKKYADQIKSYTNSGVSTYRVDDAELTYENGSLVEIYMPNYEGETGADRDYFFGEDSYLYYAAVARGDGTNCEIYYEQDAIIRWIDDGTEYDGENADLDGFETEAYTCYGCYINEDTAKEASGGGYSEDSFSDEESSDSENSYFPYTENSTMDIRACLTLDAFAECTAVSGATFYYPKYIFNTSSFSDNEAYFAYVDPSTGETKASLEVYRIANQGDKMSQAESANNYYEGICSSTYVSMVTDKANDGMVRSLVGGYLDSGRHQGIYAIDAFDGTYEYCLEFRYPEDDPNNDFSDCAYLYDCVYRYCSFSGTSYKPRSYGTFTSGDMGSKK